MPNARKRSSSRATPPRRSISVAYTFGRERIKAGDEIVLSIMEHHSNIVPWHFLRERQGAVIKWAPIDEEGNFLLDEFEKLLTPRTKMVAITHMSNALGTVVPVKEVVRIAHARGIPVLIDGAQAAVHLDVDVRDIDCDFYVFTGHKLYGPTGIGVLYGKYEHPCGDAAVQWRRRNDPRSVRGPRHLWRAASSNSRPVRRRSCRRSVWARRSITSIRSARRASARTKARWSNTPMNGSARSTRCALLAMRQTKGPIVSFELKGRIRTMSRPSSIARVWLCAPGTHCVMPLLARYGLTATCRASFAHVQHQR